MEELNEDCGCGQSTENIKSYESHSKYSVDPMVGKSVSLNDGRTGRVDDSIRNNTGEVIGYVIEGSEGSYRVFKNKIGNVLDEQEAVAAPAAGLTTLANVQGMGDPMPPGPGGKIGSGDKFPSLTVGTPAAKEDEKKKKKKNDTKDGSLMDFNTFLKKSKGLEN
jgi:hypothetical protein